MRLDQFLKWATIVSTGGQAKILITSGGVKVNQSIEIKRGRNLKNGDIVQVGDILYHVNSTE
ncbi:RNA-binding S4 domain-containing protein [Desulfofarcimen acetoxidans]|uniref:RNA-binding S4 domain-containing protein n=1 Tax=Desulfofarcimen acetoxidans TaxID=58138 RepID=UPI0030EB4993